MVIRRGHDGKGKRGVVVCGGGSAPFHKELEERFFIDDGDGKGAFRSCAAEACPLPSGQNESADFSR
jgi:hypothetical protein